MHLEIGLHLINILTWLLNYSFFKCILDIFAQLIFKNDIFHLLCICDELISKKNHEGVGRPDKNKVQNFVLENGT